MKRVAIALALVAASCGGPAATVQGASGTIIVDTGLADVLAESWRASGGHRLAVRAVGSGEAFALARRGEIDLLLVHEPEGLATLEAEGKVTRQRPFARARWVVVGPPGDPAGIAGSSTIADAFVRIARAGHAFVSRGDRSGTHTRELHAWRDAGVRTDAAWYATTGLGQAETLRAADERQAYALADEATFRVLGKSLHLRSWSYELDAHPSTTYVAAAVRGPNAARAAAFIEFLSRPRTSDLIATYGEDRYGSPLFRIDA